MLDQTDLNRAFELAVLDLIKQGHITCPTYLSLGAEHVAPAVLKGLDGERWPLFLQHRCHSWCLTWDASKNHKHMSSMLSSLINGRMGSASLACSECGIYGHDGLLGSNAPIAVGYALATNRPTVCVLGDAACEEDCVLGALGHAGSTNAPVLFVVEDNGWSVNTPKLQRRKWDIEEVAEEFGLYVDYGPKNDGIRSMTSVAALNLPALIVIDTMRYGAHNSTRDRSYCCPLSSPEAAAAVKRIVDKVLGGVA